MALKAKSRSTLFDKLSPIVGDEEVVDDLLAQFPARDIDEPITRDHMRAEFATFRGEVAAEFAAVRGEVAAEFAAVRSEVATEFAAVRSEIGALRAHTDQQFERVRTDVARQIADAHRQTVTWLLAVAGIVVTVNLAALGAAVAILR
ncbi:MAG: hypothetical protein JNK12_16110 [Acidimicrobiales bacterium]|nr:hypothetical protein [Acidimicrobiales bacterium]